jgi:hypothetical protein
MMAAKQHASRNAQEDTFGLYALRDASLARLQSADDEQARSRVQQMLSAVWDAIRALINAVLRALGLKQSRAAAGDSIGAQAQDLNARLTAASSASEAKPSVERDGPKTSLEEALSHCGFDVFAQALLRQLQDPQCRDHEVMARMLGPLLSAAAKQLAVFDQQLDEQRVQLVALGAKVINILGGPPLTLADALRIGRQGQGVQWPKEQSESMHDLLNQEAVLSQGAARRELIAGALAAFAGRAKESGADLAAHERELCVVLGPQWRARVDAAGAQANADAAAPASQAQSQAVVVPFKAADPLGRAATARERLREAMLRASSQEEPVLADGDGQSDLHADHVKERP